MSREKRIALVTGGNRSIGLEVCRQLARAGLRVLLGSRDEAAGEAAAASLRGEGFDVTVLPLDVADEASIEKAMARVAETVGRLDVLVNNAGVSLDRRAEPSPGRTGFEDVGVDAVRATLETNLYGPYRLVQLALPLMRRSGYGRIVNVSSGMGQLSDMNGGFPAYRISKAGLNVLTRVVADEQLGTGIKINSACPGWVRTGMGGPSAPRTVEEGADTIVWLATLDDDGPSGGFFRNRKPIAW